MEIQKKNVQGQDCCHKKEAETQNCLEHNQCLLEVIAGQKASYFKTDEEHFMKIPETPAEK